MAKGDKEAAQGAADRYGNPAWNNTNDLRNLMVNYNQGFYNDYQNASKQSNADYNDIMGRYRDFLGRDLSSQPNFNEEYEGYRNLSKGGVNNADLNNALAGYREFAQTGGFSDKDIQDMRARAISPTRAVYANAQANIDRQRRLGGNSSPNYMAATAKLSRDVGQSVADANTNANASIAEMRQRGRLAGLQGESTAAIQVEQLNNQMKLAGLGGMTDVDKARLQQQLSNSQQNLQALGGMRDTYSATPGLTALAAQMLQGSNRDLLSSQGQQNDLGLGLINAYINMGKIPGDFQQGLGNLGSIFGLAGSGADFLKNFFPGGGKNNDQNNPLTGTGIGSYQPDSGDNPSGGSLPDPRDPGAPGRNPPPPVVVNPKMFPGSNYPTLDVGGSNYPFQQDWGGTAGNNYPTGQIGTQPYRNDWSWNLGNNPSYQDMYSPTFGNPSQRRNIFY